MMKKQYIILLIFLLFTGLTFFATSCDNDEDEADTVTLIFRSIDSRCMVDAYIGEHPYYGGVQIPGLPVGYGDGDLTYVYSGSCPSEGIYIQAQEIGDTVFTTDYYFKCRSKPYYVVVDYESTYCDEDIIE